MKENFEGDITFEIHYIYVTCFFIPSWFYVPIVISTGTGNSSNWIYLYSDVSSLDSTGSIVSYVISTDSAGTAYSSICLCMEMFLVFLQLALLFLLCTNTAFSSICIHVQYMYRCICFLFVLSGLYCSCCIYEQPIPL